MHVQLPASLIYALGALLMIFGSLRATHLGWRRRGSDLDDEEGRRPKQGPRYHLMVGILWVGMGLFLVISTYIQSRR